MSFYHQSSSERYMKDAFQWMVPFLHRCEGQKVGAAKSLLREYLVNLAQQNLTLPLIIFQLSKPDVSIRTRTQMQSVRVRHTWVTITHTPTTANTLSLAVCAMSGPVSYPCAVNVIFMNP